MDEQLKILMEAWSEIFKLTHQYSFKELEKLGLYPGQPQLLILIKETEGISQRELADKKFVKPATITGIIIKLEANEFIYREVDKKDKRVMRVYLTDKGLDAAIKSKELLFSLYNKLLKKISEKELGDLIDLTDKIRKNMLDL